MIIYQNKKDYPIPYVTKVCHDSWNIDPDAYINSKHLITYLINSVNDWIWIGGQAIPEKYWNNIIGIFAFRQSDGFKERKPKPYLNTLKKVCNKINPINLEWMENKKICENKKVCYNNNVNKDVNNNNLIKKELIIMKTVNGKNKSERMLNKPLKYMGLTCYDSSSNKHLYATIESGDWNKYAYFMVYENPISFNQSLANGRTITKYCFHIDNFDDGKGHDAIFVPNWMTLEIVSNDVTDKVGYLVAFEKNQWNNPIIAKLDKLDAGSDSVKVLTAENIKGLKYHY